MTLAVLKLWPPAPMGRAGKLSLQVLVDTSYAWRVPDCPDLSRM
jgi:hypothetical protein